MAWESGKNVRVCHDCFLVLNEIDSDLNNYLNEGKTSTNDDIKENQSENLFFKSRGILEVSFWSNRWL